MDKALKSSLRGGRGTALASAAVLALAVFFNPVSGSAVETQNAPSDTSPAPTFDQRARAGLLDMMSEAERNSVPAIKWKELLPAIIGQGQYNLVPKKIEAQVADLYRGMDLRKNY